MWFSSSHWYTRDQWDGFKVMKDWQQKHYLEASSIVCICWHEARVVSVVLQVRKRTWERRNGQQEFLAGWLSIARTCKESKIHWCFNLAHSWGLRKRRIQGKKNAMNWVTGPAESKRTLKQLMNPFCLKTQISLMSNTDKDGTERFCNVVDERVVL